MKKANLNLCRRCYKEAKEYPWGDFQKKATTGNWSGMKPFLWCPNVHVQKYIKPIHETLVDYMVEFFPESVVLGVEISSLEVNFNYATFGEDVPIWCPHKEEGNEQS